MQCNAGKNAYAGACNVMHSKVHTQEQLRRTVFALRREWDSDDYLEETTWGLYAWADKELRNPFMQVKWETNNMQGHAMLCIGKCICRGMQCNAVKNAYAGACNVMHSKVHMQEQSRRTVFALRREWDSDDYLEETTWGLYAWADKELRNPYVRVKWETNNM